MTTEVSPPGMLTSTHVPAAATQATITLAARSSTDNMVGSRYRCHAIDATIAAAATASGIMTVNLRDGATGAGTVLWTGKIACVANTSARLHLSGLNIMGSQNTAMTLEFAGAGAANTEQTVSIAYSVSR